MNQPTYQQYCRRRLLGLKQATETPGDKIWNHNHRRAGLLRLTPTDGQPGLFFVTDRALRRGDDLMTSREVNLSKDLSC